MTCNLRINTDRLWQSHMDLADITDPALPYTRRVFTEMYDKGRTWLTDQFRNAGMETTIDAGGNLVGTFRGHEEPNKAILIGSHSDTVRAGGRFDGISGVLAGLEIVRSMQETGYRPNHTIQVWDFLGEEPNDFGLSCIGSRSISGELSSDMLEWSEPGTGRPLSDAIRSVGGDPDRLGETPKPDCDPVAAFELHIEQGRVLEASETDIGIVTDIVGIRRIDVTVVGRADHAGATPMDLRRDSLVASSALIMAIHRIAHRLTAAEDVYLVATVGALSLEPNAANVVPRSTGFTIDLRSNRPPAMDAFAEALNGRITRVTKDHGVSVSLELKVDSPPTVCDPSLQDLIATSARQTGTSSIRMASGAGHDMAFVSRLCPVAMLFVPCLGGYSHAPEEYTTPEQLGKGTDILSQAVIKRDRVTDGDTGFHSSNRI